jgi:glutaredoxin
MGHCLIRIANGFEADYAATGQKHPGERREVNVFAAFFNWWRRRHPPLSHLLVTLYTRQGCHLCETAHQQLATTQRRNQFALTVVDIDSDPELVALYGEQVPVVAVNGKVRFRGQVNQVLLDRLLEGERTRQRP